MTDWKLHIESDPNILYGKPVIKHTRIPVDLILEKLAEGESFEELLNSYPFIKKESIYACLSFAAETIKNEVIYSISS